MGNTAKTILVIDDALNLQAMLNLALKNAGYQVVLASNGQEGLEMVVRDQPDLVICDIMMPTMDGVEMFRQIKERLQDSGTPIIIITALNRKPWFQDLEAEGAVILQKPFKVDFLINLVNINLE
jgi:CheY-like chemotaxis protein